MMFGARKSGITPFSFNALQIRAASLCSKLTWPPRRISSIGFPIVNPNHANLD